MTITLSTPLSTGDNEKVLCLVLRSSFLRVSMVFATLWAIKNHEK